MPTVPIERAFEVSSYAGIYVNNDKNKQGMQQNNYARNYIGQFCFHHLGQNACLTLDCDEQS
jgi:hypothetical protein